MKARKRPAEIAKILNTLRTDNAVTTEIEAYIVALEAKQPDRPERITAILKEVEAHYSAEIEALLEAYISELEANQQPSPLGKNTDSSELLYWRSVKRGEARKARALRKQK